MIRNQIKWNKSNWCRAFIVHPLIFFLCVDSMERIKCSKIVIHCIWVVGRFVIYLTESTSLRDELNNDDVSYLNDNNFYFIRHVLGNVTFLVATPLSPPPSPLLLLFKSKIESNFIASESTNTFDLCLIFIRFISITSLRVETKSIQPTQSLKPYPILCDILLFFFVCCTLCFHSM